MFLDPLGSGFARENGKENQIGGADLSIEKSEFCHVCSTLRSSRPVKIRRLFEGKFKPNLYLISANDSTHHGDSFVNDSTDHNLEKSPMELRFEHRKSQNSAMFESDPEKFALLSGHIR